MAPVTVAAAFSPLPFRPFSVEARRNARDPRTQRSRRTLKSASSSSLSDGGGATTFTCLPLRDSPASREVTIDQFPTAPAIPKPKDPTFTSGKGERFDEEEEEVVEEKTGFGGGGPTTFARLPLRGSPDAGELEIGQFDAYAAKKSTKERSFRRKMVEHLDDGEEEVVVRQFGTFPGKKSPKGRAFLPEELDEEEDEDVVVFDPEYDRDSDDEEFDTFPTKQSPKGRDFAHAELERLDDEENDEDEAEVVVFDQDYDGEDEDLNEGNGDDDDDDDDEEEEEEGEVKEKGVPAVMRCFDTAKIYAKAGDGGNGVVAFRREKYVPYGGPSGGDGGRGGDVYVEVDGDMNSLLPFRKSVHFRAGRGRHGQGRQQAGAKGEDVVVRVPPGTMVRASAGGVELLELMRPGQRALLLPGGRGGRGNAAFKSGTNKVPKIAEKGEKGPEMWLDLELKLVADVGIVGAPNAGKSTLLSAISAAKPAIANYPFTTLLPNLGVVSLDFDATMVVADLPGLLEGAHRGYGLGHEFLRHSERCSVLVHVVDGSGQQPEYEFEAVRLELELFSPSLVDKPYIVVYNKMDLPEASERWEMFREKLHVLGIKPYCISAMNRQGTQDVVFAAYRLLQKDRQRRKQAEEWSDPENLNHVSDAIKRERSAAMNEFEILHDRGSSTWHVIGAGIERFVQMTNWQYSESLKRFQHALEACGVNRSLVKRGVKEGDSVIIGEMEMIWNDEPTATRTAPQETR